MFPISPRRRHGLAVKESVSVRFFWLRYSYESVIPRHFANPDTSGLAVEVVANAGPGAYDFALATKKD